MTATCHRGSRDDSSGGTIPPVFSAESENGFPSDLSLHICIGFIPFVLFSVQSIRFPSSDDSLPGFILISIGLKSFFSVSR